MATKQSEKVYLTFIDGVGSNVRIIISAIDEILKKHNPKEIYLAISSPGGSVSDGITLYNYLKSLPVKLTTHNIGSVDSIANVIFMAGEKRFASTATSFHFHGVTVMLPSNMDMGLSRLNELVSVIKEHHNKIAKIICSDCELNERDIENLFKQGESKSADYALDKGIIHEIKTFTIPKDSIFYNLNFSNS